MAEPYNRLPQPTSKIKNIMREVLIKYNSNLLAFNGFDEFFDGEIPVLAMGAVINVDRMKIEAIGSF